MNRIITVFNAMGVVLLAALCVFQWDQLRAISGRLNIADQAAIAQAEVLSKEKQARQRDGIDLADMRNRLAAADAEAESNFKRAIAAERKLDATGVAVEKLKKAVADRDAVLGQQDAAIRKTAGERDDAIRKYNDLVLKYNELVKRASS